VIGDPPFDVGGVKAIEACPLPPVAVPMVGVPGAVAAVTEFEEPDDALVPTELVAVTEKVYAVPLVRPVTTTGEDVPVAVMPPGDDVTV
jgi:hypothetical protein